MVSAIVFAFTVHLLKVLILTPSLNSLDNVRDVKTLNYSAEKGFAANMSRQFDLPIEYINSSLYDDVLDKF